MAKSFSTIPQIPWGFTPLTLPSTEKSGAASGPNH